MRRELAARRPSFLLSDLPDDMLLCIVGGSLRTCILLASTSFDLKSRLIMISIGVTFRYVCEFPHQAIRQQIMFHHFYIGELVLTSSNWSFGTEAKLEDLLIDCKKLHTIK